MMALMKISAQLRILWWKHDEIKNYTTIVLKFVTFIVSRKNSWGQNYFSQDDQCASTDWNNSSSYLRNCKMENGGMWKHCTIMKASELQHWQCQKGTSFIKTEIRRVNLNGNCQWSSILDSRSSRSTQDDKLVALVRDAWLCLLACLRI